MTLPNPSIVLAGGGTAGHVNPLLATAKELQQQAPKAQILVVGTDSGLETELVPAAGFELELIARVPFPRSLNITALKFFPRFLLAVKQARRILRQHNAQVVVGFGGYVSTPLYLAARWLKIPIVIHEGNARPGLANRVGARWAKELALTFPSTKLVAKNGHTCTIGMPLRREITDLVALRSKEINRLAAREKFGLSKEKPVVLVTGGSLGALSINTSVSEAGAALIAAGAQVLHITGKGKYEAVVAKTAPLVSDYKVLEYCTDMASAYMAADLVVSRAGAGMVAEVATLGLPAIFVPLPIGNGEQALNAKDVVTAKGAILVADADFTSTWVEENILPLLPDWDDPQGVLRQMGRCAQGLMPANAAQQMAKLVWKGMA